MLNISFDFNEETRKISNIKITDLEQTDELVIEGFDLVVLPNKLQLSNEAVQKLHAVIGDRISINYWNEGPKLTYPIISKAEVFDNGSDGNELKKSKTISFRGLQNDTLLKFGKVFSFKEWIDKAGNVKEGVFKLIPVTEDDTVSEKNTFKEIETDWEKVTPEDIEDDLSFLFDDEDTNSK